MITEDHLKHWLGEIEYQVNGILSEVKHEKVVMDGINVGKNGESFVSFGYLREKGNRIRLLLNNIVWDLDHDNCLDITKLKIQ